MISTDVLLCVSGLLCFSVTQFSCDDCSEDTNHWEAVDPVTFDTIPTHYQVLVNPDMYSGNYVGAAVINITTTARKRYLALNYYNIEITESIVTSTTGNVPINQILMFEDIFVIKLNHSINPGNYQLHFQFKGAVQNDKEAAEQGFVVIGDSNDMERRLIYSSYFYPLFDRESLTSTFDITVVVIYPEFGYGTFSSTEPKEIISDFPDKDVTTVKFERTPKLHPNSVYFTIHNLESLPTVYTAQRVAVTLYARSAIILNLQRALDTAIASLDYHCDYINYTPSFSKLDIMIVPQGPNFTSIAAFAYYGLAGFSEEYSYYKASESDAYHEYFSVASVTHEMAHEALDESVALESDTEVYLREGRASYFEEKATKFIYPNWNTIAFFIRHKIYFTMTYEAELTRLPMTTFTPSDDWQAISIDSIYNKGAATYRSLECFMGENNTRQGYRDFIKTFVMESVVVTDLWNAMQPYAPQGVNVTRTMLSWTAQSGYPILLVNRTGNTLIIRQTRFLLDRNSTYNRSESPYLYQWDVPLTLVASNGFEIKKPVWLYLDSPSLAIELPYDTTWVKINTLQCNYLRVLYPLDNWKMLALALQHNKSIMDPIDRGDLIDSAFALAKSEYIPYPVALDMTVYIDKEDAVLPWTALLDNHIDDIKMLLVSTPGYKYYMTYFSSKLIRFLDKSVWTFSNYDAPDKRLLQSLYIKYSCLFEIEKCTRAAKRVFNEWLQCGRKPHADARETVYNTGVSLSGFEEWNAVWSIYLNETRADEKGRLRDALCRSREPWIITNLFNLVKKEELVDFLKSCSVPSVANTATWQNIREKWEYYSKIFRTNDLVEILKSITSMYSTNTQLKEVQAFFAEISESHVPENDRKVILNKIKRNKTAREKHASEVSEWFKNAMQQTSAH